MCLIHCMAHGCMARVWPIISCPGPIINCVGLGIMGKAPIVCIARDDPGDEGMGRRRPRGEGMACWRPRGVLELLHPQFTSELFDAIWVDPANARPGGVVDGARARRGLDVEAFLVGAAFVDGGEGALRAAARKREVGAARQGACKRQIR